MENQIPNPTRIIKYICPLCEKETDRLVRHHYSYLPEKTILICYSCNNRSNLERNHPLLQPSIEENDKFYYSTREMTVEYIYDEETARNKKKEEREAAHQNALLRKMSRKKLNFR